MNRRDFLKGAVSVAAVASLGPLMAACSEEDEAAPSDIEGTAEPTLSAYDGTHEGSVAHLLPTVGSNRILIKASFIAPQAEAPELSVDG
ncbi:MAG: twin-arginine translocation signal domain-containing protein, partial [Chloroflexi bacterium]|nr:twin-arginine translocation signal domain-containing protein [Chloroflexota bacterium]